MDFRFTEEQDALRELAREILANEVTPERLKQVEAGGEGLDRETWARLAEANLLGLAIAEEHGGMGMGFFELCILLEEAGRAVAPVPLLPALVLAGLALERFGSQAQKQAWLAPLARGESVLTGAFPDAARPTARREGEAWIVDGALQGVPAVHLAKRILAAVDVADGERVVLIDPAAPGVSFERRVNSRREPVFAVTLAGVRIGDADALEAPGAAVWVRERAAVALAATQLGVSSRALEITTAYLKEREQFGAPLGALPPVQHRCADCYIDLESLRWVTWSAAWKLAEERPAAREALVAKFWAADAGSRIATATQHLHGGMGVDLDYPIHRFFLWSKALELEHGSATPQLVRLGRDLARSGPQELA